MNDPARYRDDDRPRWGSPRLLGNDAGKFGLPTSELRHRKPSEAAMRRYRAMLVIAACQDAGLSAKIVAETLGITDRHVRRIYLMKTKAERGRKG